LLQNERILGLNHVAVDLTSLGGSLTEALDLVNRTSVERFGLAFKVLSSPRQQMIGRKVWEVCYVEDNTGAVVELLNEAGEMEEGMGSEVRW
jgi:hypothetical protein